MELARAAAVTLPGYAPAILRIAELYTRYRYAPSRPRLDEIRRAVRDFRPRRPRNGAVVTE